MIRRTLFGLLALALCVAATNTVRADDIFAPPAKRSVIGVWKAGGDGRDGVASLMLLFKTDGRFTLGSFDANGKLLSRVDGKYTLSGSGVKLMDANGQNGLDGTLAWLNNDTFNITLDGKTVTWARVKDDEPAAPPAPPKVPAPAPPKTPAPAQPKPPAAVPPKAPAPTLPPGVFDKPAVKAPSLVGAWVYKTPAASGQECLAVKLNEDKTFVMVQLDAEGNVTRRVEGDYTFQNGVLSFRVDGKVTLEGKVSFDGENRYTLDAKEIGASTWVRV